MKGGKFSPREIDRIRESVLISDVIGRFVDWDRKKSNPGRGDFWACCPFHGEKNPSFHCEDGKGRYHCFGCGVSGDVFRFLMEREGLDFPAAVRSLGGTPDETAPDPAEARRRQAEREKRIEESRRAAEEKNEDTRAFTHRLFREAVPIEGTPAEAYLRNRGIGFPLDFPALRYHPRMNYRAPDGTKMGALPCLVAAVQAPDDRFLGIWRIYITEAGEKADVPAAKMGLGEYTSAGGGVRLGRPDGRVNVCEGIETGLGIFGILGGAESVLCGLNTTGLVSLQPPPDASSFRIWPDGDVDKIRMIKSRDGERERHIESPGIKAAKELRDRMAAVEFPTSVQPTPKNGRDYLDLYVTMKKASIYGQDPA